MDSSFSGQGQALSIGSLGNVRMQTLTAFSKEDMNEIIAKMI